MPQNPTLNENIFERVSALDTRNAMTLQGSINKTFLLLFICVAAAMFTWTHPQFAASGLIWLLALGAFAVAVVTAFKPNFSPFTAPVYAALEGLLLGGISAAYNAQFNGIVFNAVAATLLVFFIMLAIYRLRIIRVTRKLAIGIMSATGAICLLYIGSWLLSLFGVSTAYLTSGSPLSIAISVVVCGVAAFNFLLDFDFIDRMTQQFAAPKYMEWYAGFSLLVTLIWLYIEILRLLGKMSSRR